MQRIHVQTDVEPRSLRLLAHVPVEGVGETQVVQNGRPQLERQTAHAFDRFVDERDALG